MRGLWPRGLMRLLMENVRFLKGTNNRNSLLGMFQLRTLRKSVKAFFGSSENSKLSIATTSWIESVILPPKNNWNAERFERENFYFFFSEKLKEFPLTVSSHCGRMREGEENRKLLLLVMLFAMWRELLQTLSFVRNFNYIVMRGGIFFIAFKGKIEQFFMKANHQSCNYYLH